MFFRMQMLYILNEKNRFFRRFEKQNAITILFDKNMN